MHPRTNQIIGLVLTVPLPLVQGQEKLHKVRPRGVGVEHWPCNPRVSGAIHGAGNLKRLFIWMKIHGLTQKQKVTEL